jgi:EmrB/QacA subfamily drug resistance transporter
LAVGCCLFLQFIDSTALATALPTLGREFGAGGAELRLVLTTYMIVQALFLPASGWAADRFGPRRVFMTAIVVFLIGSVLCALSQSLPQMIAARAVQGLGGAILLPVARIIVIASNPREDVVKAMMWVTLPALVGPIIGPPMAGAILSIASWPWIFLVNLPVGLLGMAAVMRLLPKMARPHPGPFDGLGFLLSATVIAAVMTLVEATGTSVALQFSAAVVAAAGAVAYWLHARARVRKGAKPVLDLSLFRYPTVRASFVGGSFVRLGIGGTPYALALLLQSGLQWTPLKAGAMTIASAIGALFARSVGPTMIRWLGFRNALIASAVGVGVFSAAPALFTNATALTLMTIVLALSGVSRATQFSAVGALAFSDIPDEQISAVSTMSSVLQQITLSLGVTLAGLLLAVGQSGGQLQLNDFYLPFIVIGVLPLISAAMYLRLPANVAEHMSGRRSRA